MPTPKGKVNRAGDSRYQGFELKSVCWGYREIFREAIDGLFRDGVIGPERRAVTAKFFDLLKQADQNRFDHVLKEFLGALNPRTRWLIDLPGLFGDITGLGGELARSKLYHGTRFFKALGAGDFGDSPEQVRNLLTQLRRLREIDEELAMAFLKGHPHLMQRLAPPEMERYIEVGLAILPRNRASALAFMEGKLQSSEAYIRAITQECRLSDVQSLLGRLMQALVGYKVDVRSLRELDSDDLVERGSSVVCMYRWVYLPERVRDFGDPSLNRQWYLLAGVVAAATLAERSFSCVHGHPDYRTCAAVVGDDPARLSLFQIVEYVRVLRRIRERWPGARRLLDFGLRTELEAHPPENDAEHLFFDAALGRHGDADVIARIADASVNLFDTAHRLRGEWASEMLRARPGIGQGGLRPLGFMPDFLFPAQCSGAPLDRLVADLKHSARKATRADEDDERERARAVVEGAAPGGEVADDEEEETTGAAAAFVYDEWSRQENDYYRDHCLLYEEAPTPLPNASIPADIMREAQRVSRVFEQFKPDLTRREKYLRDGDAINVDLLMEYLVQRHREPFPRIRFYERPRVRRRDLAVVILIDVSGSTSEQVGAQEEIIDIEKHAALILGQGLASLGDRFAIMGFNSNGREHCAYYVYRDFDEPWDRESIARVLSAHPANSTRMGPALRHSGYRLSQVDARQRLILIITDGRPMDQGYDPNTRYAQYDVRMACTENARLGIHTFGISTEENSLADMEIMFPRRRFAILSDIRQLVRVLPGAYIRITT